MYFIEKIYILMILFLSFFNEKMCFRDMLKGTFNFIMKNKKISFFLNMKIKRTLNHCI